MDADCKTALIFVSIHGHRSVLRIILREKNVNINAVDNDGKSALDYAKENNHKKIMKFLKKFGAE